MNTRLRLLLAVALAFVAVSAAPVHAQAKPEDNKQTKQAKKQLDLADAGLVDPSKTQALYTEALDSANVAMKAKPGNPLPYLLAGRALVGLKRYQEADAALDKAVELRKEYATDVEPVREARGSPSTRRRSRCSRGASTWRPRACSRARTRSTTSAPRS